jgi:hypothetical protein
MATIAEAIPGAAFGKLTILATHAKSDRKNANLYSVCACSCGNVKDIRTSSLGVSTKKIKSCGSKGCKSNGRALGSFIAMPNKSRTFRIWREMLARTSDGNIRKGLVKGYSTKKPPQLWFVYDNFLADMGECPDGMTLERLDSRLPYGPDNCAWATRAEQARNRECVRFFKRGADIVTLVELAKYLNMSPPTASSHVAKGSLPEWVEMTYAEMQAFKKEQSMKT